MNRPSTAARRRASTQRNQAQVIVTREGKSSSRWVVLAPLVAAVIGASAGIGGSLVGAKLQTDANEVQSARSFEREQRLDTYTEFIALADDDQDALIATLAAVRTLIASERTLHDRSAYSEVLDEYFAVHEDFSRLITKVKLIGSDEAFEVATTMWDTAAATADERGAAQSDKEASDISREQERAFSKLRSEFIGIATDEVQQN